MALSLRTLETLIDLVEIKLSCMEVFDRDDAREVARLEESLDELRDLAGRPAPKSPVVEFQKSGRGRRRLAHA
jgi:hypothetical protein